MWNLTKDGFLSVVAYDPKKDQDRTSPFPSIAKRAGTHLLVRARRMEHLEPLKKVVPALVIVDDRRADYRFRAVVKRKHYKQFLCRQVDEIDYWSHFKEAMREAQPPHLKEPMYRAAMSTWGSFASLQASAPYKGSDRKSAPLHESVADYQTSRGVKPFRTAQLVLDEVVPEVTGELSIDAVERMIAAREGALYFSSEELGRMSDDAFELVTQLQENFGVSTRVTSPVVASVKRRIVGFQETKM